MYWCQMGGAGRRVGSASCAFGSPHQCRWLGSMLVIGILARFARGEEKIHRSTRKIVFAWAPPGTRWRKAGSTSLDTLLCGSGHAQTLKQQADLFDGGVLGIETRKTLGFDTLEVIDMAKAE